MMNQRLRGDALPAVMRVENMSFSYPGRHVFTAWSGCFSAGLTWLKGYNGCGKSTLLKVLAGALPALSGRIEVSSIHMAAEPLAYRREVFWVGPGAMAFDHLTPAEYFGFMRGLYPRFDARDLERHITAFALAPHLAAPLRTLSTGTQRKVWIAAALVAGTSATLLDEPINALDAASHAHLLSMLSGHAQDRSRAWIVSSHEDLGEATPMAAMLDMAAPSS